jgi:hypothetical protein
MQATSLTLLIGRFKELIFAIEQTPCNGSPQQFIRIVLMHLRKSVGLFMRLITFFNFHF